MENALYVKIQKETLEHLKRTEPDFGEWQTFYIPVSGKRLGGQEEGQDLAGVLNEQLINHPEVGSCLIVGSSGMGKTSFSRQWVRKCWEQAKYTDKPLVMLWIPLLSIENPKQDLLSKHLRRNLCLTETDIQSFLKSPMRLVTCCDGYDELNTTDNLYPHRDEVNKDMEVQMIYTCRPEVIQRDSNYRWFFNPMKTGQQLLEYELVPFKSEQRKQFITEYISHNKTRLLAPEANQPDWRQAQTYVGYFDRILDIKRLISNPFLLFMSLQALPQIVKEQKTEQTNASQQIVLTRQKIYETFMDKWWEWQIEKLEQRKQLKDLVEALQAEEGRRQMRRKQKGKLEDVPVNALEDAVKIKKQLTRFTQKLALAMFQRKLNEVEYEEESRVKASAAASVSTSIQSNQDRWKARYFGNDEGLLLIRGCLPLVWLGKKRAFIHKSLLEYFAAEQLFKGAVVNVCAETGKNLDAICLVNTNKTETLNFLIDRVQQVQEFEKALWEIIELSKSEPRVWRAAANAMTLLNAAGKSFTGKDLSRVHIGGEEGNECWGADLSGALLESVDFTYADLRYVNLSFAWLRYTQLRYSIMANVQFGENPYLVGDVAAYAPNCKWVAVITNNFPNFGNQWKNKIKIYEIETSKVVKEINHVIEGSVNCLCFSPDSQQLAVGDSNGDIYLLNSDLKLQHKLLGRHKQDVKCLSYGFGGKLLASGGGEGNICFWNPSIGKLMNEYQWTHLSEVTCLTFRNDSKQMVSGGHDRQVIFWNINAYFSPISDFSFCDVNRKNAISLNSEIASLIFTPDGNLLIAEVDGRVILRNFNTWKDKKILELPNTRITALDCRPDGKQIALGKLGGKIQLWDGSLNKCQQVLDGPSTSLKYLDEKQLMSMGGGEVCFWNIAHFQYQVQKTVNQAVGSLAFIDSDRLATGSASGVHLWNIQSGKSLQKLENISVRTLCCHPANSQIAAGLINGEIHLWDLNSDQVKILNQNRNGSINALLYLQGGRQLVSAGDEGAIRLWETSSGNCIKTLIQYEIEFLALGYQANKKQFASSSSSDGKVILWDADVCEQKLDWIAHDGYWVTCLSYHPNKDQLASGSNNKNIRIWNVNSKQCLKTLNGHTDWITTLDYRPDGRQLASGSWDATVRLWDSESFQCVLVLNNTLQVNVLKWSTKFEYLHDPKRTIFYLAVGDKAGAKVWRVEQSDFRTNAQLVWSSTPISMLESYEVDVQGVIGLKEQHYRLLQQRGGNTVKGRPSAADPATVIQQRNMQKYVPSGEIDVQAEGGNFKITSQQWLISMVRERSEAEGVSKGSNDNGHVYLILQGLDKNNYTVIKEFHLYLNKTASSFTFFDTRGKAAIKIHDSSPWLLKEKQSKLIARSWVLSCASAEKLIERIEQQQHSKSPTYSITGRTGENCLSWCVKQLEEAGIPIDTNPTWRSFICAVPSDYLPDAQPDPAGEPDTKCRIM